MEMGLLPPHQVRGRNDNNKSIQKKLGKNNPAPQKRGGIFKINNFQPD